MKFIRFKLRNGDSYTFSEDQAKSILTSNQKLIPIHEKDGQWHGRSFNKADIVNTEFDYQAENRRLPRLAMPVISDAERRRGRRKVKKLKEYLIKIKVIR